MFRTKDGVREHAKNHSQQDKVTEINFVTINESMCHFDSECQQMTRHYHCLWVSHHRRNDRKIELEI